MNYVTSSHTVEAAIPEQTAGQLAAALGQPCERPLHRPATRLVAPRPVTPLLLLADPPDVRDVARVGRRRPTVGVVIPLVQAQVLLHLRRVGALDHDRLDRP